MVKLNFYAGTQHHFADFLAPLYNALPESIRGTFYAKSHSWKRATSHHNVDAKAGRPRRTMEPFVVASHEDYRAVRPAPVVMVNHGIGQRYWGVEDEAGYRHQSYSGGRSRERIVLNLCPSESDAAINRQFWPDAVSIACGPWALDDHIGKPRTGGSIVVSFHLDAHVAPETRSAFDEYAAEIVRLHKAGLPIIGHGHPRAQLELAQFWKMNDIGFVPYLPDALDRADVYICDNSSTLYEAAALDIPVVVLNSIHYRRDVHHGLRFWSHVPGVQCDQSDDLEWSIRLAPHPENRKLREVATLAAYDDGMGGHLADGNALSRAVDALVTFSETYETPAAKKSSGRIQTINTL